MECNREEAIRAKAIAEKKFADKDFNGAKKFTLKAQTLFPELDGISQMLVTFNVYVSSEKKINGESDWYGVLDVKPSDDDETIRKQYRKLVLMLHPDKNKSVGADGAFKILSEAWNLLSDKAKRSAYNQRRNLNLNFRGFGQKVKFQSGPPPSASPSPWFNGVHVSPNKAATPKPKHHHARTSASVPNRVPTRPPPPPPPTPTPRPPTPVVHRTDTFWTLCYRCKMNYEYPRVYLNHTLLCPTCHKPFLAAEMVPPVNIPKPGHHRHQGSSNHACNTAGGRGNTGPSVASRAAASFVPMFIERLKREREGLYAQENVKRRRGEDGGQSSNA